MKPLTSPPPKTVSVVIPCYNGMPYLAKALETAVYQTHRAIEIIVVDDGSTDRSDLCVQEYARAHPDAGIKLVQQENQGEPAARNAGIAVSTGHWVASLDTDDWWEPKKLEKQLAVADRSGASCVLIHTGIIRHFSDGRYEVADSSGSSRRVGWCTEALLEPAHISHPSIMVRRDILDQIKGYDETFKQACDIDLYFRLSVMGAFAFVEEPMVHYRYHAAQMSEDRFDQIQYHFRAINKFIKHHPQQVDKIGIRQFHDAMVELTVVKLESYYWRRCLSDFRKLLAYANQHGLDNPQIDVWRKRGRWPNWSIHIKDCLCKRNHCL